MNQQTKNFPILSPPGAGLPKYERFIANWMIHWKSKHTSREKSSAIFSHESGEILRMLQGVVATQLKEPVLIKRLRGLEDSSRYWSLLMVIDHLRIVNAEIMGVITCLANDTLPKQSADIIRVKPSSEVNSDVIPQFIAGCEQFTATLSTIKQLHTQQKFSHPWFGPMDAASWHFMAGFHMQLHSKQMD